MDNGWASAQTWAAQQTAASQILDRAARDRLPVIITTTAPDAGKLKIATFGPMPAGEARGMVGGIEPRPWPADYATLNATISKSRARETIHSYWIGHGLSDGTSASVNDLARALQQAGSLTYIEPEPGARPVLLLSRLKPGQDLSIAVSQAIGTPAGLPLSIDALGGDGRVLERVDTISTDDPTTTISIPLPESIRMQVSRIHIAGRSGAGAVLLLDDQFERRSVGLVTTQGTGSKAPLTDASYFITRAIEPYANIQTGAIDDLINNPDVPAPSVMILPDIGAIAPDTLNRLEDWVKKGGLLLRFAGPNMTQGDNFLTPVPLLGGGRAMDGDLTWDKPQTLSPFDDESPFYGIDISDDIQIRRQILAAPAKETARIWATLSDGTPLVTAAQMDNGLLGMVYTTASPEWSDLALSGVYVEMLRRIIAMAGSTITTAQHDGTLQPLDIMNGMGALSPPGSTAEPIDAKNFDEQIPDSRHPPGYYGHAGTKRALNMGERISRVVAMPVLPNGVTRTTFTGGGETDLMPVLLAAALILFLIDWMIMMVLQSPLMIRFGRVGAAIVMGAMLFTAAPASAQSTMDLANGTWLAHISSGDPALDSVAHKGLQNLDTILTARTSVEPAGVVMVDPERDDLAFFPLIYWPISPSSPALSSKAITAIQFYLDHGGVILFDTRDQASAAMP